MNSSESERDRQWDELHPRLRGVLLQFGKEDYLGRADFYLVEEDWGTRQHKVEVQNLALMAPPVIESLQRVLRVYPDWAVVVAIAVRDKLDVWPPMGLVVRSHEIIDGLKRQYLPEPYRSFQYKGSRPGTEND